MIASMRWTDGLNPKTEEAVEADALKIVNALNSFDASKVEGVVVSEGCVERMVKLLYWHLRDRKERHCHTRYEQEVNKQLETDESELSTALLKSKE